MKSYIFELINIRDKMIDNLLGEDRKAFEALSKMDIKQIN